MPSLGFLRGLKFLKGAKGAVKIGGLAKVGSAVKSLPVFRIAAGSAVGVAVVSWWNDTKSTVSESLGLSEDMSGIVLVVAVAVVLALIVSILRRR